jgi:hypothetical protein
MKVNKVAVTACVVHCLEGPELEGRTAIDAVVVVLSNGGTTVICPYFQACKECFYFRLIEGSLIEDSEANLLTKG